MAKSSRSSIKKTNNQKLKRNVFGPVENARAQRLSEKLLELAQQPLPAKDAMDVEKDQHAESNETQPEATEAAGLSIFASWPVPRTLEENNKGHTNTTAQEQLFYQLLGLSNIVGCGSKAGEVTLEFLSDDQIG
ncbi:uncharacterized protein J3D65DRAFT_671198 [Phyllosticta citribraziliensis]|uniref:DUF2423 domain-containing protein n=1 Tax=Phyllosticta citribraziliensis TaxID=989973 RepID=A0ABR1L9T7_9PEZI